LASKIKKIIFIGFFLIFLLIISCSNELEVVEDVPVISPEEKSKDLEKKKSSVPSKDFKPQKNNPGVVDIDAPDTGGAKPWEMDLYLLRSDEDGMFKKFNHERTLIIEHGAVPNLLLTSDGSLIATFQYFYDKESEEVISNGKMSYSISKDEGETWSEPQPINFNGLPEPELYINPHHDKPVDPSLVQLDDGSFRLYFTYAEKGESNLRFSSAKSDSIDGVFEYEEGARLDLDGYFILDPTVVFFNDQWHHYTTIHSQVENDEGEVNLHSVSDDGLSFEIQDNIVLGVTMLGGAVVTNENKLLFFGSAIESQSSVAVSEDGYNWEMDNQFGKVGSDPGVVQLEDGTFLVITQASG